MDFSKFKTSDWLMVGGGGGMLIAGFLPWVSANFAGISSSVNAFEFFFTGTLPWLMLVGVGVIAALAALGKLPESSTPWPLVLLGLAGLATLLVLLRLVFNPIDGSGSSFGVEINRSIGLFLGVIAAVASTVGAVQNFQATGGNLNDLKDIDKLKESFSGGSDGAPPPPSTPPPPPSAPPSTPPPSTPPPSTPPTGTPQSSTPPPPPPE